MIRRRGALQRLALGGLAPSALPATPAAAPAAFEFVALGDMPYGPDLIAGPAYRHLIELINQAAPRFAIHIGDFKDGTAACSDDEFRLQWQHVQRLAGALIYTPGDTDWLDCHRRGDDPLERLRTLRQRFFSQTRSLGRRPIALQRQSELMPAFADYRENQCWLHQGVVFASFHTVGPNNGFDAAQPRVRDEARRREAANAAWIASAFDTASASGARALVLATQAESLRYPDLADSKRSEVHKSFPSIARVLLPKAQVAPFPVLLVHGDHHRYVTDQPFQDPHGRAIANLWRLQVYGEPRIHAVRVRVQPEVAAMPFVFTPIWNPMSPDPRWLPRTGS